MNTIIRLVTVVAGLALLLHATPSWGQTPTCVHPGCNPTGSDQNANTAGGSGALFSVSGFSNTAFGFYALNANTTGGFNSAFGDAALLSNGSGGYNTAVGVNALYSNAIGNNNTAIGNNALFTNTIGTDNTATGWSALSASFTGSFNTATGSNTLINSSIGSYNTATGYAALHQNSTASFNTATGAVALQSNTTGINNTATGGYALEFNSGGSNNTAVGFKALRKSLGTKNIGIGHQAGVTLTNGNNDIYIGNAGNGDESQTIRIGTAQTQTFIAGIANASISNAATVIIDTATGQLGTLTSSARYKEEIAPMASQSEGMLQLRPVTFAYRSDAQHVKHYGLVAEEVAAVYPELVTHSANGEVQTVKYQELIPMLLNELQRERQDLRQALQMLQHQQQELSDLRALVGQGRGAEAAIQSPTVAVSGTDSSPR